MLDFKKAFKHFTVTAISTARITGTRMACIKAIAADIECFANIE